jgi:hypothetical protein
MTDTTTATVTAMLDGVTPGPWISEANGVYAFDGIRLVASLKEHIGGRDWPTTERDRNFIAWARDAVPALAAERKAAIARIADLEAKLDRSHTAFLRGMREKADAIARAEAAEARLAELEAAAEQMAEALREIAKKDDAGDLMYRKDGPFAVIASAALSAWHAAKGGQP